MWARLSYLQTVVLDIKQLERDSAVSVRPFGMEYSLHVKSVAMQATVSKDEWSMDRLRLLYFSSHRFVARSGFFQC
jgi:hypothetical protein